MKKLRYFLFSVALVVLMILPLHVLADQGSLMQENQKALSLPQTTENVAVQKETTEAITGTPVRGPAASKNFTLTKTADGTETTIGDYDVFMDVISAMDINDATSLYTIYLNKDTTIPSSESCHYRSNNKIRLTSGSSGPFTLTREGEKNYIAIQQDAALTIDNIILDGNKDGECLFISNNGKVTIGEKTTIQNFVDSPTFDGPAIFMTGGTLTIEDGAILQNNTAEQPGGVIQARKGTTVNINGGIFRNNASNTSDGGAIAAYGELNITGGSFDSNSAKKTGGAIIVGANGSGSIEKATFKANKASTGGAIYALRPLTIADSSFEGNQATWGGAVFSAKKLTLRKDTTFKGNQVNSAGGAAYLSGGAEIQETQFTGNTASQKGGAIYLNKGDLSATETKFTNNLVQNGSGGAIFAAPDGNGTITISKSAFSENASLFGGGIYLGRNVKLGVNESEFTKNEAAFGAGISSAGGTAGMDTNATSITINKSTFGENEALLGAGVFTAFPTEIDQTTFTKNTSNVHPKDDQTNPHQSGTGGAIYVMDQKTQIKGSTFTENSAYGSGGAIAINGWTRNDNGEITGIKKNIGVSITNQTQFIANTTQVGQGGAIYVAPYGPVDQNNKTTGEWRSPINDSSAYSPLTTDKTTLFQHNISGEGLFIPPSDYAAFTNLAFDPNSDVQHGVLTEKSLLNNYDVNYKNPNQVKVTFDANGGAFADKTTTKDLPAIKGKTVTLVTPPTKQGYTFTGWNTQTDGKGTKFDATSVVNADMTVYAQWKKATTPGTKPTTPILRIVKIDGDGNRIPLPVTFKITDKMISSINRVVTTDTSGEAKVEFLATGDYSLEEIKTPEGYIPLDKPLSFSVKDGRVHYENQIVRTIYVKNDKKAETPDVIKPIDDPTRQDIASTISKTYFGDAKKVILVQNMAYADSMSAMNVSQGNIPILYTQKDALFDVTKQEILRTERDEIIVMGGPGTISEKVIDELKAMTNAKITRVGGIDRFEVNKNSAAYLPESTNAVIASGMIYTDALSSVPYAHQWKAPILLVREDRVPEFVADVLKARIRDAVISGGEGTIAPETKQAIEAMIGKTVSRVDGADRYVVSAKMAEMVMNPTNAIITSGEKWSDALVAGPVAQKLNAPVLLTKQANLPMPIDAYLNTHTNLEQILIVGGPASVGESVRNAVKAIFPVK
ncbi:cell wall-binding repeat-containing protein [Murdochiella sp. Marseille-P8839]|nr:cell wall-binding repeat-containing protein [Murdochiella sp. Marseille-P8839]